MSKCYDKTTSRLICLGKRASSHFWDEHWNVDNFKSKVKSSKNNQFILKNTRRFLKKGKILEGGCGVGGNVYCLHYNNYSAFGVDFAKKTVKKINKYFPELKVSVGDVRKLKFRDKSFDGYWSLGVIEHYYEGYKAVLKEMRRVLKKGGYIFVTFPYMSPLRKFKAKVGFYKKCTNRLNPHDFYQFVLDFEETKNNFEKHGFSLKYKQPFDGLKGFKDEVFVFKPILQKLYDYHGKNFLFGKIKSLFNYFLTKFSAHMLLVIFQKN